MKVENQNYKRLMVFDFQTKKTEEIDVSNVLVSDKHLQEIVRKFGLSGIKIEAIRIKDSESFVKNFYEHQGYSVERLNCQSQCPGWMEPFFKSDKPMNTQGVPDLVVYKSNREREITEAFFVEVKQGQDVLRIDQLKWIFDHSDVPIKIFFCER